MQRTLRLADALSQPLLLAPIYRNLEPLPMYLVQATEINANSCRGELQDASEHPRRI